VGKEGATGVYGAELDGFVAFLRAGEQAAGEFRCSQCGYGVSVHRALPLCPICGGASWEEQPVALRRLLELGL
jgi:rubrerythrin